MGGRRKAYGVGFSFSPHFLIVSVGSHGRGSGDRRRIGLRRGGRDSVFTGIVFYAGGLETCPHVYCLSLGGENLYYRRGSET